MNYSHIVNYNSFSEYFNTTVIIHSLLLSWGHNTTKIFGVRLREAEHSMSLCSIHSRSKTVQNQWISRRFRSFPFKLVQRFYRRTSKHPQDVRPYPLRTYVHSTLGRTTIKNR